MAAVGEAAKPQQEEVVDCRKWGRYLGRIYRGKHIRKRWWWCRSTFRMHSITAQARRRVSRSYYNGRGEGGDGDEGNAGGKVAIGDGTAKAGLDTAATSGATADG